jgi:hypothetical protein
VVTIELSLERARSFFYKVENHFGTDYLSSNKSKILINDSNSAISAKKILQVLDKADYQSFDAVFIDGFNGFETVLLDFLIYSNFVKKSGILLFMMS